MIDYIRHIEEYYAYWFSSFSSFVPKNIWGNKKLAEVYLNKYWLPEHEYKDVWKPIQDKIFLQQDGLPDLIFTPKYKILALRGGHLFAKKDFEQLKKVLLGIGETEFVIIQNTQDFTSGEPMFKMKFPVNISWKELISGNYISAVLFEMHYNEYFVFGASGKWGKYSATEFKNPVDIIGFKPEFASIFMEYFKQSEEDREEIKECLPATYKKLIR